MLQSKKLFNNKKLRAVWDTDRNTWWVSIIDVIAALRDTDYDTSRNYWKQIKCRMRDASCKKSKIFVSRQIKLTCKDGKQRFTDVMRYKDIIRLIQILPIVSKASRGLLNFRKFIAKLAADTKAMADVFNEACVKGYFNFNEPLLLQTTICRQL